MKLACGARYRSRDGYVWEVLHRVSAYDLTGDDIYLAKLTTLPGTLLYKFWPTGKWVGSSALTPMDLLEEVS